MIDKLVSSDLIALGRDAAARVPPLDAMLPAEAPASAAAPMELLTLASAYSHRVARAAFGGAAVVTMVVGVALARSHPHGVDWTWFDDVTDMGTLTYVAFAFAVSAVSALAARRRGEARFARAVAAAADPLAAGRTLLDRLDAPALALPIAAATVFVAAMGSVYAFLGGSLFHYAWYGNSPHWIREFLQSRLTVVLAIVPVIAVLSAFVARRRDRLRVLEHAGVMWGAAAVALVAWRIAFQLGADLYTWQIDDPIPPSGDRTAAVVVGTLAAFVAITARALRRRRRELAS